MLEWFAEVEDDDDDDEGNGILKKLNGDRTLPPFKRQIRETEENVNKPLKDVYFPTFNIHPKEKGNAEEPGPRSEKRNIYLFSCMYFFF